MFGDYVKAMNLIFKLKEEAQAMLNQVKSEKEQLEWMSKVQAFQIAEEVLAQAWDSEAREFESHYPESKIPERKVN